MGPKCSRWQEGVLPVDGSHGRAGDRMKFSLTYSTVFGAIGGLLFALHDVTNYRKTVLTARVAKLPEPDFDPMLFLTHVTQGVTAGVGIAGVLAQVPGAGA